MKRKQWFLSSYSSEILLPPGESILGYKIVFKIQQRWKSKSYAAPHDTGNHWLHLISICLVPGNILLRKLTIRDLGVLVWCSHVPCSLSLPPRFPPRLHLGSFRSVTVYQATLCNNPPRLPHPGNCKVPYFLKSFNQPVCPPKLHRLLKSTP